MRNREYTVFLIPLMAAIAFFLPSSSSRQSSNSNQTASSSTENSKSDDQKPPQGSDTNGVKDAPDFMMTDAQSNAAALIYEFLSVDRKSRHGSGKTTVCRKKSELVNQYKLEFMVATLPDPKESRLNYLFDRNFDAIQRAVESAGFVVDRFDLPWQDQNGKGKEKGDAENGETNSANQPGSFEPSYKHKPGVVLFRSRSLDIISRCPKGNEMNPPTGRLLALFIVGKTPTAGVHKAALKNALDQITLLSRWKKSGQKAVDSPPCLPSPAEDECSSPIAEMCSPPAPQSWTKHEIRVMGPTFSGSEDSFELALQSWLESSFELNERPIFSVISGSATSISQCRFCHRLRTPGQPRFYSTVPPSQFSVEAFRRYLVEMDPDAAQGKIAIFKETNTSYGQSALTSTRKPDANNPINKPSAASGNQPPRCNDPQLKDDPAGGQALELPFPLHISQLRTASEKAKSTRAGINLDLRSIRRPLLPLLMDDGRETNDVAPLFSQLEPASLELVLSNQLFEIDRERVRYVGIISTDVKDCIFLVGEIRKHCPNAMVFTFFADLLYLRPEVNLDMQGTMVITPYPLFGVNQFWSYPFSGPQTRLQFPTQVTQGAYNATLALLGQTNLLEYGNPFEEAIPGQRQKPALWMSVVGRENFWPVRTLPYQNLMPANTDSYTFPLRAPASKPGTNAPKPSLGSLSGLHSRTSITVMLLLIGIGLVIPIATLTRLIGAKNSRLVAFFSLPKQINRSWFGETFGDPAFDDYKFKRRLYLVICCTSLIALYLPIFWVFLLPSWVQWQLPNLAVTEERRLFSLANFLRLLTCTVLFLSMSSATWLWGSISDWTYLIVKSWLIKTFRSFLGSTAPASVEGSEPAKPAHSAHPGTVSFVAIAIPGLALVSIALAGYLLLRNRQPAMHIFFFIRAVDLTSGISPLLPILMVGMAGLLCSICALRRWSLVERMHRPHSPEPLATLSFLSFENSQKTSFIGVGEIERRISHLLKCSWFQLPAWPLVMLLLLIPFWHFFINRFIPTIEGFVFDWLVKLAFGAVSVALAIAFLRFVCIWVELRRLLRRFSAHPLFSRPPRKGEEKFADLPKLVITSPAPNYTSLLLSAHQASRLCQLMGDSPKLGNLTGSVREAEKRLFDLLESKAANDWRESLLKRCETQEWLAVISQQVSQLLEPAWSLSGAINAPVKPLSGEWAPQAESFLAGRILAFLHYVIAHMQNLVIFVTTGMLLLLLAITSYPFQPRDLLLLFGWLLILSVVITTLAIFVQMDRDKVLSIFSGSVPGQLNWSRNFVFRVLIHGLLPILALLSAQFPEAIQQIFSWFNIFRGGN